MSVVIKINRVRAVRQDQKIMKLHVDGVASMPLEPKMSVAEFKGKLAEALSTYCFAQSKHDPLDQTKEVKIRPRKGQINQYIKDDKFYDFIYEMEAKRGT